MTPPRFNANLFLALPAPSQDFCNWLKIALMNQRTPDRSFLALLGSRRGIYIFAALEKERQSSGRKELSQTWSGAKLDRHSSRAEASANGSLCPILIPSDPQR